MNWKVGEVCGPYQLLETLGQGAMGEVWKALDSRLGRLVALKFLSRHHHRDAVTRGRFSREGRAVSALNHPNILTVYEAGEVEGIPYIASELVEGRDLFEVLRSEGPLDSQHSLEIAVQLLDALESAHSLGIIHRDIKPQNIRLRGDGIVKLLDFGAAMVTDEPGLSLPGRVVGTPRYMAPEQIQGLSLDARADLFAVGAVLFEMLAGRPAFEGSNIHDVLRAVIHDEPRDLIQDERLKAVVARALKKDKEERFADANEMKRALLGSQGEQTLEEQTLDLSWMDASARVLVAPVRSRGELADLADGVTREIQNRFTLDARVRVVAAEPETDLEAARRRMAHYLLEGGLRRAGDRVRFQVSLTEVDSGYKVWGETLTTYAKGEFELEDELVEWLEEGCSGYLQERRRLYLSDTADRELHQLGSSFRPGNIESLQHARMGLEALLERFPQYGLIQAHLSMVLAELSRFESPSRAFELLERAQELARVAVLRMPEDPYCLVAAGRASLPPCRCDWEKAKSYLQRSLEIKGDLPIAHALLAYVEVHTGKAPAGICRARRLLALHPQSFHLLGVLSLGCLSQGRFLEARDPAERMLRDFPDEPVGFALALLADLYEGATERLERYLPALHDENRRLLLQDKRNPLVEAGLFLHESLYDPESANLRTPEDFDGMLSDLDAIHVVLAAYSVLGQTERVEGLLKELYHRGYRNHLFLGTDPFLEGVRRHEWFQETLTLIAQR